MLSRREILELIEADPPLVDNLFDGMEQVQPNGVDLTIKDIARYSSAGVIGSTNESRVLSNTESIEFNESGMVNLSPGCYLITHNEVVNLPNNVMALARPRSSLLRCGVAIHTAVWDAGYSGRSQSLMVVYNQHGFRLERNARVVQLVFSLLSSAVSEGYNGIFQGENIQ
jgi:dUTP pyrophosphatase